MIDDLDTRSRSFWRSVPPIVLGACAGLLLLIETRARHHEAVGYAANMGPRIAYFGSPVVLAVILVAALPMEAVFRRADRPPRSTPEAFACGVAYSTLVSFWAFAPNWWVFIGLNPVMCRWLVGRVCDAVRSH
jgi:hypothetical protein